MQHLSSTDLRNLDLDLQEQRRTEAIKATAQSLMSDLAGLVERVDDPAWHLPSLGIIQAAGSELDRLIGELHTLRQVRKTLDAYDAEPGNHQPAKQ